MAESSPSVIILAGPNGAGKSTAARTYLAESLKVMTYVNADIIAQGLAGFDPESAALEASRIMLERLRALAAEGTSFAFETTLAARSYARYVKTWRDQGYIVRLAYVWVRSPDLSVARVAQRVRTGGHHVPEAIIRQRYERSVRNFFSLYRPLVHEWQVYDNSESDTPELVAFGDETGRESVILKASWERMKGMMA